ncbi:transglutaminase-like domain-containing protein [Cellulomonas alba]|uniref:Transglutaminase-like domain-containing protein n=1 Tax=Cellulomonas alba TaxID=3053467 RepID=A0ABT7SC45_9CELL|nr:transglutaminase-like domain-containing protein [Cellulomonas alba]MDM7853762.1 transglutaminase-like domain-containing protein [Cellulomonas alba]
MSTTIAPTPRTAPPVTRRAARRPARRGVRQGAVDALCLLTALGFALAPLLGVYGGATALPALVGGLLLGAGVAAAGAARRWSAATTVALLLVVGVLGGGALAVPATTVAGVVPTAQTARALVTGATSGWKQVVTLTTPLGSSGAVLVPAYLLALVGAAAALSIALRVRHPQVATLAALVPVAGTVAVIVLGTRWPHPAPRLTGVVEAALLLGWAAWRAGTLRARRVVATGLVVLVGLGAAALGGPVAVGSTPRYVVRDEVVPPFDPSAYPSPLSAFRAFVKDDDETLFTVSGLPAGGRIRLATMDRYDGVVWNVSGDGSAASGEFRRVGATTGTTARGTAARVRVTIDKLTGVWLPTVGDARSFHLAAADAADLRYNDATGGAVLTSGVHPGDAYSVDVVVPPVPDDTTLAKARLAKVTLRDPDGAPQSVSVTAADVARDAGTPVQVARTLATWLSTQGYFSHGITTRGDFPSLSGHGADRMTTLLGSDVMVGDGEQYASAMALMARAMGLPARVVLGFVPGSGTPSDKAAGSTSDGKAASGAVAVKGRDVQAWVEVDFVGYGWVPFDATPPAQQTPQQQQKPKPAEPDPQVVQPPPVPPAAVKPPDVDTEQPQTDAPPRADSADDRWRTVATVAGAVAVPLAVVALPFVVIGLLKARRRRRRRRDRDPVARVAGGYAEVLDRARDLRRPVPPTATRVEAARALATAFADAPARAGVATRVDALARAADRAVFAPGTPSDAETRAYWADVDAALSAMSRSVRWRRRVRARLSTASLRRRAARPRPTAAPVRAPRGARRPAEPHVRRGTR